MSEGMNVKTGAGDRFWELLCEASEMIDCSEGGTCTRLAQDTKQNHAFSSRSMINRPKFGTPASSSWWKHMSFGTEASEIHVGILACALLKDA